MANGGFRMSVSFKKGGFSKTYGWDTRLNALFDLVRHGVFTTGDLISGAMEAEKAFWAAKKYKYSPAVLKAKGMKK